MNIRLSNAFAHSQIVLSKNFLPACSLSTGSAVTCPSLRPLQPQRKPQSYRRAFIPYASASTSTSTSSSSPQTFKLAPSDFAFLWKECKRCFYLKVHGKMYRPRAPFPTIFGNIDLAMKRHFRGLRTTDILPEMPPGTFLCEDDDAWVESLPISPSNHTSSVFIRGMIDCLVRFDDGTYGIIDFKTSAATSKSSDNYGRQLHAYAKALQNPSPGSELEQCEVSDLGLIIYTPSQFHTPIDNDEKISAALTGNLTYVNIEKDDDKFNEYLSSILDVLTLPEAPEAPKTKSPRYRSYSSCPYCQYLYDANKKGLLI